MDLTRMCLVAALGAATAVTDSAAQAQRLSGRHDGAWSAILVCEDVRDRGTWVKGYRVELPIRIVEGRLSGQHGAPGKPSSLALAGAVQEDGQLDVTAAGVTGDSSYAAGRVAQGTPYSYTLRGSLGDTSGQAVRREVRPCTVSFSRG